MTEFLERTARRVALIGALVCSVFVVGGRAEIIEQILVKVNGAILTKSELEMRQSAALRQSGKLDPNSQPSDAQVREWLNDVTPRLLVDFIDETLLVQRGKELGLKMTDAEFKTSVDQLKKQNKIETDEQLQAALKQEGMTMDDLRAAVERPQIAFLVRREEVLSKLTLTEAEARLYYDSHMAEFSTPPAVTLREIFVAVPKDAPVDDAKKKADAFRQRVIGGEDFAKLAGEVSDSPSRANAGLVGPLSLTDLSTEIRAILEPMKVGDVSQPLRTPAGFQILKLDAMTPKQTMSFEEARPSISDKIYQVKQREEFEKYLNKLRAQAIIVWRSPDLKKAYEEGVKQGLGSAAGS